MHPAFDWIVVGGFFLLLAGVGLRVALMMKANDGVPVGGTPVVGGGAVAAFRRANPRSKLPAVMWGLVTAGIALLVAGYFFELR